MFYEIIRFFFKKKKSFKNHNFFQRYCNEFIDLDPIQTYYFCVYYIKLYNILLYLKKREKCERETATIVILYILIIISYIHMLFGPEFSAKI